MFQARIVSPRGSLYFAAEATSYDLENLRTHIRDLQTPKAKDVRLEFSFGGAMNRQVSAWLRKLSDEGVEVSLSPPGAAAGSARSPLVRR